MARPSSFTQETADAICEAIMDGQSLRRICEDDAMPNKSTVLKWLRDNEAFSTQYARAREIQGDSHFDDVGEAADQVARGEMDPQAGRVFIDARKWQAGKLRPKVYGDKVQQQHTGPDGGPVTFILGVPRLPDDPVDE